MNLRSILLAGAAAVLLAGPVHAQAPAPGAPETTGSVAGAAGASSALRQMTVEALGDMELVGADGKEIGEIEGVVEGQDGKRFALVERGGFLGIGAKTIAVPLDNLVVQGDRLMLRNLELTALDAMPAHRNENNAFREIDDEQQVGLAQQ
ncbi:MAG TPA: PRC-barrel domain-containing protein [Salinarimonas sp.]|nr:PRC-barrel domain-containing protein [Salinarimonas sp.]